MSVFIFRNIRRQTFEKEQLLLPDLYLRRYDLGICTNLAECSVGYSIYFLFIHVFNNSFIRITVLNTMIAVYLIYR